MSNAKILLQVSGSIAAFKAVALCSKLVQTGHEVEVVMTEGAEHFVGPASFEGLSGRKVYRGNFDEGSMMAHIDLERWADLILLYPASANTISELANGLSRNLVGALFLAHEFKKPYWIAPAMNQAMLAHPLTQKNLATLQSLGISLLMGAEGSLACGEIGAGRLMEPEAVLERIKENFNSLPRKDSVPGKRILVTAGGTTEPIDPVRSLTNFSTGRTGFEVARALEQRGHQVTLLQSKHSRFTSGLQDIQTYDTTLDFKSLLETKLADTEYDVLIHSAAVADYSVEKVMTSDGTTVSTEGKIQADTGLVLKLKPNPKIIRNVRKWSRNPNLEVISFKLTSGKKSEMKLESYDSEWILHNDLSHISESEHLGTLFRREKDGKYAPVRSFQNKRELSDLIQNLIEENGAGL